MLTCFGYAEGNSQRKQYSFEMPSDILGRNLSVCWGDNSPSFVTYFRPYLGISKMLHDWKKKYWKEPESEEAHVGVS